MLDKTGNIRIESGAEALRQQVVNRVRLQRREYGYDTERGIDWSNLLLTDTPLMRIWEQQVMDIINSIPEVKKILEWNTGVNGNNFEFSVKLDTDYGIIEIKG